MNKIIDEFTDLPISRTKKWELRNPEKAREMKNFYSRNRNKRLERMVYCREFRREQDDHKKRYMNSKSYQLQKQL